MRPVAIVSTGAMNEGRSGVVLVVPVTAARRDLPSHVEVEVGEPGLDHASYAECENVKSVSDRRLMNRLGVTGSNAMTEIGRVLRYVFEF